MATISTAAVTFSGTCASDLLRSSSNGGVCRVPLKSLGKARLGAKMRDFTLSAKVKKGKKHEYPWPDDADQEEKSRGCGGWSRSVRFGQWVLHDWNDEECIQILKNCKEAIPKDKGKVIIVEAVIDEEENNKNKFKDVALMLDMAMMTHTNTGKERTLKEWAYVLGEAGFSRHTVKSIRAIQSVIEAYP